MELAWPVVLASASPRRQELMKRIVPDFEIYVADIDETPLPEESPWQTAERLAKEKAVVVLNRHPDCLIIAGDTVVALQQAASYLQLAKPIDKEDACRMLKMLSAKEHLVVTGMSLLAGAHEKTFSVTTRVKFRELSDAEIQAYVETGEPMDKAGAYAIQGGGAGFVESYEGSVDNVIGFPVDEIRERLQSFKA